MIIREKDPSVGNMIKFRISSLGGRADERSPVCDKPGILRLTVLTQNDINTNLMTLVRSGALSDNIQSKSNLLIKYCVKALW